MSAVLDTFKLDALRREDRGFTTMREYLTGLASDTTSVSGDITLLDAVVPVADRYIAAYTVSVQSEPVRPQDIGAPDAITVGILRADSFVVSKHHGAATMSAESLQRNAEKAVDQHRQRGISTLRVPRKIALSYPVSFLIADLPRKLPRVQLSNRSHEEDDA